MAAASIDFVIKQPDWIISYNALGIRVNSKQELEERIYKYIE